MKKNTLLESQYSEIMSNILNLLKDVDKAISLLSDLFPSDTENQINVKFPEDVELSLFSKAIDDLDFIFRNCRVIYEANNKEPARILKVDHGSIWLSIAVNSIVVMSLIGGLAGLAYTISKIVVEIQVRIQNLRVMTSVANNVDAMEDELQEVRKKWIAEATKQFIDESADINLSENDHEAIDQLGRVVSKMSDMYTKNIEIFASLEAPSEVKALFPKPANPQKLITKAIKLLPTTNDE